MQTFPDQYLIKLFVVSNPSSVANLWLPGCHIDHKVNNWYVPQSEL